MSPFPRIGLVLSGGGSRGVAHVGVLRALADRGIEPDEVAGVSSGAIVGALYAAGYPPAEMLRFFAEKNPFRISNLSWAKPGFLDSSKVVPDFEEYFPNDSFEALGKRLRIIATDLLDGEPVVFDSGPLILPVIASSSVPMLFTPTEINGRWFADGGISDNFPVRLLSDDCDVILGVHVGQLRHLDISDLRTSLTVLQRAMEVGMFLNSQAKYDACDLVISPTELSRFTAFDTKQFEQIEAVGHEAALGRMDEIERLIRAKQPPD